MRVLLFIILFLYAANVVSAQESIRIYDLLNELRVAQHDTTKINIYNALAKEYYAFDPNKSIGRAGFALSMAENINDTHKIFQSLDILLKCHYEAKFDLPNAYKYLTRAKQLDNNLLTIDERQILLGHEGRIQVLLGSYEKAQTAFFSQLEILEQTHDKSGLANVQYDLGKLYVAQNDPLTAVNYFAKALDFYTQTSNIKGKIEVLNALGNTYERLQNYEKSLQYCSEALFLTESIIDLNLISNVHINMGVTQIRVGKNEEAEQHFRQALQIGEQSKDQRVVANAANQLGMMMLSQHRDTAVVKYLELALEAATSINDKLLMKNAYESLYNYYDQKSDLDNAYEYLKQLNAIKEQLYSDEQAKQFIVNRIKYETERKEAENKKLKAKELESQLTIQKQKVTNYAMLAVLLLGAIMGYVLFRAFQQKKANNVELEQEVKRRTADLEVSNKELIGTNQRLEQSNSELERFAYIASHDLKSPLRNIISFLNLIDRKVKKLDDDDLREYLRFATDNARQMHVLIQDVLEFSRIESDKVTIFESVDLNESLMMVLQNLQEPMQIKAAAIQAPILPVVQTNSVHILQVFQNLIGNGIKYNESGQPLIEIDYQKRDNEHQFAIHDNGIGISAEYHEQIFEMFKRLHTRDEYKGTGIGLAICKKIVMNLGGRIWIDSEIDKGSTFYFTLPDIKAN